MGVDVHAKQFCLVTLTLGSSFLGVKDQSICAKRSLSEARHDYYQLSGPASAFLYLDAETPRPLPSFAGGRAH